MIKTKSNIEKILNSKGKEKISEKTKNEKILINEATETILKIKKTIVQTKTVITKSVTKEG